MGILGGFLEIGGKNEGKNMYIVAAVRFARRYQVIPVVGGNV
jgi:hypothetical protein